MSTRGAVGTFIGLGKQWRGVYNHYDSYPTGLGHDVWEYLHHPGVDLKKFCHDILTYNDWREYRSGGLCEYCGKVGVGQPHSILGSVTASDPWCGKTREEFIAMRKEQAGIDQHLQQAYERELHTLDQIEDNRKRTGFPDPDAKHHAHDKSPARIYSKNAKRDALFIEWAYVVNPMLRTLTVFVACRAKGQHTESNGENSWQQPNYCYKEVCTLLLEAPEPDWEAVSHQGNTIREETYEQHKTNKE